MNSVSAGGKFVTVSLFLSVFCVLSFDVSALDERMERQAFAFGSLPAFLLVVYLLFGLLNQTLLTIDGIVETDQEFPKVLLVADIDALVQMLLVTQGVIVAVLYQQRQFVCLFLMRTHRNAQMDSLLPCFFGSQFQQRFQCIAIGHGGFCEQKVMGSL